MNPVIQRLACTMDLDSLLAELGNHKSVLIAEVVLDEVIRLVNS